MRAEMGESGMALVAGAWVDVFLCYKKGRNTKSRTNIWPRVFYVIFETFKNGSNQ